MLGVSFKSLLLTSMNIGRGKKKAASGISAFLLLAFIMLSISVTYAFMFGAMLAPVGGLELMLLLMALMAITFPMLFTLFSAQNMIFSTKDIDLVLSLPLSSFSVMMARMLALYLDTLFMVELVLVPTGIAWWWFGGANGPLVLVLLFVLGFFLSLLPTLVSLVLGGFISILVSRMPFKNLFITLFSLISFVALYVGMMYFNNNTATLAANFEEIKTTLISVLPPLGWLAAAATGQGLLPWVWLLALCVVPFMLVTWLFSLGYKKVLTGLSSHAMKRNYKLRGVKTGSATGALLRKEAGKFFGTPIFLMNCGIGIILLVGASVAAVLYKSELHAFMADAFGATGGLPPELLTVILLAAMGFFISMVCTSAVSISLEGKTLWILKEAPLSTMRIFMAKAGFNFILNFITVVLCAPLLGYAFSLPALNVACIILLGILYSALCALVGLFVNLLFPRMDADNDTVVVKQSASVIVNMLAGWVLLGVFALLYYLLQGFGFIVFVGVAALLLAALCVLTYTLLNTKGKKIFATL